MLNNRFFLIVILVILLHRSGDDALADEIVLRTGQRLSNVSVVSVDHGGVGLSDGSAISLDRISSATLKQQQEFEKFLKEVGDDLFRLRVRMERRDFENLQPHLDRLYPVYESGSSRSALLVHLSKFEHELLEGHFELAIVSHFRIFGLAASNVEHAEYLKEIGYHIDLDTGLSEKILPVGISSDQIARNWESILAAYRTLPDQHPHGLDFYFFRLARMGSQEVDADISSRRLQLTPVERMLDDTLDDALSAKDAKEIENARLRFVEREFGKEESRVHQALYHFVSGLLEAKSEAGNRNSGLLQLLQIHAEMAHQTEAVSAAALFQVVLILRANGSRIDAKKVSAELKSRYPSSIFAKQLKMEATN